jgi:hypothetical protein
LLWRQRSREEWDEIKILVSLEDEYRSYREVIAATIRILRPHAEVATSDLDALGEEMARFDPHVVICRRSRPPTSSGVAAWVELAVGLAGPARVCVGGRYSEQNSSTLDALLAVIDEVERLIQAGEDLRRC